MGEIGILIAIVLGGILLLVLLNKLLDFLCLRFPIPYNIVLIVIILASNLAFAANPGVYCGLQILFFYMFCTHVDAERYSTIEGSSSYNDFTDTVHHEFHEEKHYRPGWWNKLILVVIFTVVACLVTYAITSPILTMVLELILPVWAVISCLRKR